MDKPVPDDLGLWTLARQTAKAIVPLYQPAFEQFKTSRKIDDWTIGVLMSALSFEPQPISPALLSIRGPYTSAEAYLNKLKSAAERDFLIEIDPGKFHLTAQGRLDIQNLMDQGRTLMADSDPLAPDESQRLAGLLDHLVRACLDETSPPGKWCVRHAWKLMPHPEPPLPYMEQAFSCLSAYRDDAHLAAWQASGLSAVALEALTCLWRAEVDSLETVNQKLSYRGHPSAVYSNAVIQLRKLELIAGADHSLRLTVHGQAVRDQIEQTTDEYFFKPWSSLNEEQKAELANLLQHLNGLLQEN